MVTDVAAMLGGFAVGDERRRGGWAAISDNAHLNHSQHQL